MASKKSKILAIAFCAAVMSGIYVNPVLAAEIPVSNGSVTVGYKDFETTTGTGYVEDAQVTITNIASQEDLAQETADRKKADADLQGKIDGHTNQISSIGKELNYLKANDEAQDADIDKLQENDAVQDAAIGELQENDAAHDQAISDLELENDKQDSAIAGLDAQLKEEADARKEADAAHDQAIGDLELENDKQDSAIAGLDAQLKEEADARQEADNEIKADLAQETNDREVADKIESTLREWGDEQLQENIEAEAEKREQADNQIKNDLKQETVDRIAGDNALNNAINKETVEREAADTLIREDLAQETADREKADADLQDKIGQEEMNRVNEDAAIRGEISKEHADRVAADADHQEQLDDHSQQLDAVRGEISEEHRVNGEQNETLADHQEQLDDHSQQLDAVRGEISSEIRDRTEADKQLQQSIDIQREVIGAGSTEELKGAYSGTNYISDAENMVEADRKLDAAISDVNSRVDGIESRVDGLEGRIDKVGAMSAAIANLRTMGYDPAAPTEVAVGVGQYRDETGMALGLFHYPNRDFMLSLSVSTSGDEYMGGIGATWKFGRKSPEKVTEIKKAQAEADARRVEEAKLAKAEEMKKAAKEAKVQAQMERHAKLAAERAALEEA